MGLILAAPESQGLRVAATIVFVIAALTDFADGYRRSFTTVLAAMEGSDGPQVIRYDTSTMSTVQIAADVADKLAVGWCDGQEAPNDIDGAHGGGQ